MEIGTAKTTHKNSRLYQAVCTLYNKTMEDENKKKEGTLNKLIMGVILGGAIGSVVGLTFAPRKGKETREIIKQKGAELYGKGKESAEQFVRDHRETIESAKYQLKKKKGFFRWLFSRKKKNEPMPRATMELPDEGGDRE